MQSGGEGDPKKRLKKGRPTNMELFTNLMHTRQMYMKQWDNRAL